MARRTTTTEVTSVAEVKRALETRGLDPSELRPIDIRPPLGDYLVQLWQRRAFIWMEKGRVVLDGDAVDVARKYRWCAHNLAQGNEEKATGLLSDAILEGESVRAASMLTLPEDSETDDEPADRTPELEPDPLLSVFTQDMKARRFPGTIFPSDSDLHRDG